MAIPPAFRLHGMLKSVGERNLSLEEMQKIHDELIPPHLRDRFIRDHEVDLSHHEPEVGRFRVNVFQSHGVPTVAIRHVKTEIPACEQLSLPDSLKDLAFAPNGIVLVCGTTGSGKSTSLAALIQAGAVPPIRPASKARPRQGKSVRSGGSKSRLPNIRAVG